MAGVEEIRAGIALANEKASASIAALQQAAQSLEEAQQSLASDARQQPARSEPGARVAGGGTASINGLQSTVQASISSADSYSARLLAG